MEGTAVRGDLIDEVLDTAAGRLAAYGYLLTGSQRGGEELVQAAIVKVLVRRRRLHDVRTTEGYVRECMRALHLAEVRRATTWRARVPWLKPQTRADDDPAPPASGDLVSRALAALPPQERAAVVLRHHDKLQVPEIAIAMRVAEGTVERLLDQAHAALAATLGPLDPIADQVPVVAKRGR